MIILIYNNSLSFLQEINNEFLKVSAGFSIFGTIKDHKREWRGSIFLLGRGGDFVGNGNSFQKLDSVAFFWKSDRIQLLERVPIVSSRVFRPLPNLCTKAFMLSWQNQCLEKKPHSSKNGSFLAQFGPKSLYALFSESAQRVSLKFCTAVEY